MSAARILRTLGGLSAGPAIIVELAGGTLSAVYVAQLVGNDVSVGTSRGEALLHCGLFVLLAGGTFFAPSLAMLGPRRIAAAAVPGWALDLSILVIVVELATIGFSCLSARSAEVVLFRSTVTASVYSSCRA